ncbi:VWA domain-containing protein [Belliella kenyensis]|uniref:VWA domain-containing protein n=1 Tax=Belliella kenyensis TaxID=1472724 RepID=A0ABV8EKW0_9BACT|nr:VWA domain-containing protein [Belliella kenyensis]MCH7400290.1 VWA domain-containing protein [Belliella kenyensis]MDN3604692.1 VWA domain-containing protein [Belliella kenyensis]MDN3605270.1 VWA domain-containing protein [Belliella kenyensis]
MIWAYPDGKLIIGLAIAFGLLYAIYLYRFYLINRKLKVKKHRLILKLFLRLAYFALFLIAIAGPSVGTSMKEIKEEGKDIYFVVDLSQSMNATDIGPSRLQKVKFELKNLAKQFAGDRLGLIIFSSEAFIQCPLTFDQNVINLHIDGLNTNLVPNQGTDLLAPLQLAMGKFTSDDRPEANSKSIVLISDGEDFGENFRAIINDLNNEGIKIFSLGVGTSQGSTIPKGNSLIIDPKTNQPAITRLDPSSLKYLAAQTDGGYFELSDENQEIPNLIAAIERQEGAVTGSRMIEASANKYFYFLLAGLALALIDMILPFRTINL